MRKAPWGCETLSTAGDEADAHFVRVTNPFELRTEDSLQSYIEKAGGETEAKAELQTAGFDGIAYGEHAKVITFNDDRYWPVEKYQGAADVWTMSMCLRRRQEVPRSDPERRYQEHARHRGAILRDARRSSQERYPADKREPQDLDVYSVPRAEVEEGVREYDAAKEKRDPDYLRRSPTTTVTVNPTCLVIYWSGMRTATSLVALRRCGRMMRKICLVTIRFNNSYTHDEKDQYIAGLKKALILPRPEGSRENASEFYDNSFLMAKSQV